MIRAIHKLYGTVFQVLEEKDKTFTGRVLHDSSNTWKRNEVCPCLDKSMFHIILDWQQYDLLKKYVFDLNAKLKEL